MDGIAGLLPFVLIILVFYFFIVRRSQRAQQTQRGLQESLREGQQVMTTAGLFATVTAVEADAVLLEVAPGVVSRYAKAAIARVVEPVDPVVDAPSDERSEGTGGATRLDGTDRTDGPARSGEDAA